MLASLELVRCLASRDKCELEKTRSVIIARARGRTRHCDKTLSARVFPRSSDRSLPVRALLLGISENQRRFRTYHVAPDDEAAARLASALRASFSAVWILGVSGWDGPNTRVNNGATDSSVSTLLRRSSSVALLSS